MLKWTISYTIIVTLHHEWNTGREEEADRRSMISEDESAPLIPNSEQLFLLIALGSIAFTFVLQEEKRKGPKCNNPESRYQILN